MNKIKLKSVFLNNWNTRDVCIHVSYFIKKKISSFFYVANMSFFEEKILRKSQMENFLIKSNNFQQKKKKLNELFTHH